MENVKMSTKKEQITSLIAALAAQAGTVEDGTLARAIGTVLYDIPMRHSGKVSQGLINKWGFRPSVAKCCKEHFHSRQQSGLKIIEMQRQGQMDHLPTFIDICTTVHYTTSEENTRLASIQNHPSTSGLSWKEQYKMAGVKMVEDPGTMPRKMTNALKKTGELL